MVLKKKRFIMLLLVVFTMLFVLFGSGSSMGVEMLRNGTGDVTLTIGKEKVAEVAPDFESFKTYFNGYVTQINSASSTASAIDAVTVKNYKEDTSNYKVTVNTRRIDNVKGLGSIRYGETKGFWEITNNVDGIKNAYRGLIISNWERWYPDGSTVTHNINGKLSSENGVKLEAKSVDDGEILTFESFRDILISSDKNQIIFFQLVDLQLVDEIEIKLPGNVKYVSVMTNTQTGEEMEVISCSGSKVTLKPTELKFSSGTQKAFFGYFVYGEGISGWLIAGIIAGVLALFAIVFFGIIKGGFKRFFKGKIWGRMVRYRVLYLLILPAFILIILFRYMPMVWLSAGFMEYDLLKGLGSEFVGFKYFKDVFYAAKEPAMYRIFRNTIFISLIRILSNLPVILLLSVLINQIKTKKLRTAFQAISFIPYFLSWVSVGGIFNALLDPNTGMFNKVLGIDIKWYADPDPWWAILSLSSLWKGMGWGTLIYISAMCNIDNELYEACSLDGGGLFRQVLTVTLPGIMNIICLQLILDVSNIMRDNYEQILAMTKGLVYSTISETTDVVGRVAYSALRNNNFGPATTIGLIQGVIGTFLVLITNKIVKKTENEGII